MTASTTKQHPIFTTKDEYRHEPGPESNWQESQLLQWYDQSQGIGGWHRLGHEPNNQGGRAVIWSYVFSHSGWQYRCCTDIPLNPSDIYPNGFGAGDRLTGRYENDASIWEVNDGELSCRLECRYFYDLADPFPPGDELAATRFPNHFEVAGHVTGEVVYKGNKISINGLGYRDHSWGNRDWNQGMLNHRWFTGSMGEEFSFAAITAQASTGKLVKTGYVARHGQLIRATDIDVIAYVEPDGLTHRGGKVRMTLENGEQIRLNIKARAAVLFQRGTVVMVETMCDVEGHGLKGFCDAEFSSNPRNGTGDVLLSINAVTENGFSDFKVLDLPA